LVFFHYIYSFCFTVLVFHPHHDHPVTTVLTLSAQQGYIVPKESRVFENLTFSFSS